MNLCKAADFSKYAGEATKGENTNGTLANTGGSANGNTSSDGSNVNGELIATYTDGTSDNLGALPSGGESSDTKDIDKLQFEILDDGTVSVAIKDADKASIESITIPKTYNGHTVSRIKNNGFKKCTHLQSVIVPDSVEEIGEGAFQQCSSLQSISLPDSVTNIEYCAFYLCTSLKEFVIPSQIAQLKPYVLGQCYALELVVIPKNVTSIHYSSFRFNSRFGDGNYPNLYVEFEDTAGWPRRWVNGAPVGGTIIPSENMENFGMKEWKTGYRETVDPFAISDPTKAAEIFKQFEAIDYGSGIRL